MSRRLSIALAALTLSDVIVYVRPDVVGKNGAQAHLSFLSSAGGVRYLVVHLPVGQSKTQQMATGTRVATTAK